MKCNNCGRENDPEARFCANCGSALTDEVARQSQQPQSNGMQNIPPEYSPISMWGYFGYELLFAIPCVGLIMLLIFSFGGTQNQNLKNFARSYFCMLIIVAVLVLILALSGGLAALMSLY